MSGKMEAYEKELKKRRRAVVRGAGEVKTSKGLTVDISGSGVVSNEVIRVSGSARLPGGIKARILHVSGSASIDGDASAEKVKVSGSTSVNGVMEAEELRISGSFKARGVKGGLMRVSGSCLLEGPAVLTDSLHASGSLRVMEDLSVEKSAVLEGGFDVAGKLKAETLRVELHNSDCHARGGIEAVDVEVRRHWTEISFLGFRITRHRGRLFTPFVKASGKVHLENVICNDVSGRDVDIGDECEINGAIQYSGTVSVARTAKVAKSPMKVEER